MRTILTEAYRIWVTVSEVFRINKACNAGTLISRLCNKRKGGAGLTNKEDKKTWAWDELQDPS